MTRIKQRRNKRGILLPATLPPKKKYPFRVPIPPCSIVRVKLAPRNPWRKEVGRSFRIGYYSCMDGLDCIRLVNHKGEYEQSVDHQYLAKFFDIESVSEERSLYGLNRAKLPPLPSE